MKMLKRRYFVGLAFSAVSSIILTSCFGLSPEETVKKSFDLLQEKELPEVKYLFSSRAQSDLDFAFRFGELASVLKQNKDKLSLETESENVRGNIAEVGVSIVELTGKKENVRFSLILVKENGEWKIDKFGDFKEVEAQKPQSSTEQQLLREQESREGEVLIGSINVSQQAYYLENDTFSPSLEALAIGLESESKRYVYSISLEGKDKAIATATAKRDGLRSYTGAVFVLANNTTRSVICKTDVASKTAPAAPSLNGAEPQCGASSIEPAQSSNEQSPSVQGSDTRVPTASTESIENAKPPEPWLPDADK